MDPHEPVAVYTVNNAAQAELIRGALEAEGIPCQIEGHNQAALTGTLQIRLFVAAMHAEQAREFLKAHEHSHADDVTDDEG